MRKNPFLGVNPETKFKKNVKANKTEIDNVIFSPPIFGKWNTDITIPKISIFSASDSLFASI